MKRMFAAIEREGLDGIRYASIKQEFYASLPGWYAEAAPCR